MAQAFGNVVVVGGPPSLVGSGDGRWVAGYKQRSKWRDDCDGFSSD